MPSAKLQGELKSDAVARRRASFPKITFKSTKVTKTGTDTANVTGDLTLHGVTKPVTLDGQVRRRRPQPAHKTYTAGFEAKGKIKRSDFGVKTYVPLIGDEVDLMISGAFEHQG